VKPFSLQTYNRIPRVGGLVLSPDGGRLVLTVQELSADGTRFVSSLWELATDGRSDARRLTYSDRGESSPTFLPDGSLLFASARPDPTTKDDESEGGVWRLPSSAGEAHRLLAVPAGVSRLATARSAPAVLVQAEIMPGVEALAGDAEKSKKRKEAGTSAILFEGYPIRYWDQELGPRQARLLLLADATVSDGAPVQLASDAGQALHQATPALTPDGTAVVSEWMRMVGRGFSEDDLVVLDGSGCRVLATGADFGEPAVSPDGSWVVAVRNRRGTPELAPDNTLWLVPLAGGEGRDLTPDLDLWPHTPTWSADSRSVYFTADELGHSPVFAVDVATGKVTRLAAGGAFSSVCPAPDGATVYALRSSVGSPNEVVRIDADGSVTGLPTPGLPLDLASTVTEVAGQADDGREVRGWLVLPADASAERPVPLAVFIHGGPLSSWNSWSWRWCPHLLAERGYAVLLPDPALSTGYGHDFIQRAWGSWGERAFTDLMAITDAALERPDLDATRTAALGGSFGGYMANWVAGHTDRFRAIVSHAGLWALEHQHSVSDIGAARERQFGDPYEDPSRWLANSPRLHIGSVSTPMLVIHGQRDYRVPISHALWLWTDLQRHEVPSQYLFFPDENHWILKPGNVQVWYETVLAFLDHHVLGQEYRRPELV
jgi:dipeptidyl aminopeptidase/acylaminoacyl peptidase